MRIEILAMRTWGEFGNRLAATSLQRAVASRIPDADVVLLAAEDFVPTLAAAGSEIAHIADTSRTPDEHATRYRALMDRIADEYPPDLAGLAAHFRRTRPDLVIGTKGLIARLCATTTDAPVGNHVTNQGLLGLRVHLAPEADRTWLPFEEARRLLLAEGFDAERLRVVGPLIARHDLRDFIVDEGTARVDDPAWDGDSSRPRLIVFCNRGGEAYVEIVRYVAQRHPDVDLVFVGYGDPDLTAAAERTGQPHWRFRDRLTQAEYFGYVDAAGRAPHALLVSKAGPNTTMEAAYFGIPVLSLRSGLPTEDWVAGLIEDHALGRCASSLDELLTTLDAWLANPAVIAAHKKRTVAFARAALDQETVVDRIGAAVRELL